jgi:ABC-2 type transport system ATP-binding protein
MEKEINAIKVNHLKKSYKKVGVLKDVSFSVRKGEIFALLGANGSGKTTTINILTTLIKGDGGSAVVNSFDVNKDPDKVRHALSLTGQFAAVDDILTARENLVLIGDMRHIENSAETANELLKKFDLTEAADRRVMTFSGGMRRRLDIAMSLIGNPEIIFFDEPTTGLDPESRIDMWKTISKLAKNGTTVFLTTQYLEEADQLANTIAILKDGKIVASGTPKELKKLVPGGIVEFTFHDTKTAKMTEFLLRKKHSVETENEITIKVVTDGSIKELSNILAELNNAKIEPSEFAQKVPSLEDVFLKLIKEGEEK